MIENRPELAVSDASETILNCVEAAIEAATPSNVVGSIVELDNDTLHIGTDVYDLNQYSDIIVVGGGKAAGQMTKTLESILGEYLTGGTVVTNDPTSTTKIEMVNGSHPIPNENGVKGTESILRLAEKANKDTLVLAAISGGGSALLSAPSGSISLDELQDITEDLLASGASIREINTLRKHLSEIKGGKLAQAAAPATVVGLVISDVVGDDLSSIASGPFSPDLLTFEEATEVAEAYDLPLPPTIEKHLAAGLRGEMPETPSPESACFNTVHTYVIANGFTALNAACNVARQDGYESLVLSSRIRGEAREIAKAHIAVAEEIKASGTPVTAPAAIISGGETTVTLNGKGEGGPNQEFALSGGLELSTEDIVVASVDTDGVDGSSKAAGAIADSTISEPVDEARSALDNHDVNRFLSDKDALIHTGPTGTNVNDIQIVIVEES